MHDVYEKRDAHWEAPPMMQSADIPGRIQQPDGGRMGKQRFQQQLQGGQQQGQGQQQQQQ